MQVAPGEMGEIMSDNSQVTKLATDEARGGETTGVVRYILIVSVALSVLAMGLIGMTSV